MKPPCTLRLSAILLGLLTWMTSCQPKVIGTSPTPRKLDPTALNEATADLHSANRKVDEVLGRVQGASGKVSDGLREVDAANDRAITKSADFRRAMDRVRELMVASAENDEAIASVNRLNAEMGDELAQAKEHLKTTLAAKAMQDTLVSDLSTSKVLLNLTIDAQENTIDSLSVQMTEQGKEVEAVTKERNTALHMAAKSEEYKNDRTWWRWYGFAVTLLWVLTIALWISWKAITGYLRVMLIIR